MYNGIIHVNNYKLTAKQVKERDYDSETISEIVSPAIEFIADWISGQQLFEIKTSGSTGKPKVISVSRRQMSLSAQNTIMTLGITAKNMALVAMNTKFIGGKMMIVRALESGMDIILREPSSNPLHNLPVELKVDFTALVPLQLKEILEDDPEKLNQIKYILIGGATVLPDLEVKIKELKPAIYQTFGMTETVSHIALRRLNGVNASDLYTAFENINLSQDERGCLIIKSEITNNQLVITNDIVEIINRRQFRWIGRIDNVINSGGVKIHIERLEEIMAVLFQKDKISNRFIISKKSDSLLGEKVILVIEGNQWENDRIINWLKILKSKMPSYHVPKEICFLNNFPLTPTGKIIRYSITSLLNG